MQKIINQLYPFIIKFKKHVFLNIFFNTLYALFTALAFVSLIPMLNVLFDKTAKVTTTPVYTGIMGLKEYAENLLYFKVGGFLESGNAQMALLITISIVISTFLLKNIFGYLAMYFITFLRNGVLKDVRNDLYEKTVDLPLAYFSEKRKGDIIARISTDVLEIQHSFLSILELIVREPLMIIFTVIAMLALSPQLTLFVFIFIISKTPT